MLKRLVPLSLFAACIGLMYLVRSVWPVGSVLQYPVIYMGAVPALVGWGLTLVSLYELKRARTTCAAFHAPARLVTGGVYRFTRNPIYLGLALVIAGGCVFLGANCLLIPVPIFLIVTDRWIVRIEERVLARRFGAAYEEYRSRVPRWI